MFKVRMRAFRAIDDENSCRRFLDGHRRILETYGISKITSNNDKWIYNPKTVVILVESEDGKKLFGGSRIQGVDGITPLPIERALSMYDAKIHQYVNGDSTEVCGLWNSREVAGYGFGSMFLCRVSVALAGLLPTDHIFMLCAPATVKSCKKIGCIVETSLGNEGLFYYPKEDLIATAMHVPDPPYLSHAIEKEREYMFDLRRNLRQIRHECGIRGDFQIEYDLLLPDFQNNDLLLAI